MRKSMVPLALMLALGLMVPAGASAKEDTTRDAALQQLKNTKKAVEDSASKKADDKGTSGKGTSGKGKDDAGKNDDKGKDDKGGGVASDDQMKNCFVYTKEGKKPRPDQRYITKADEMRLKSDDRLKQLAGMIYYDDSVRYPEKADDPKSYNPRYNLYSKDDCMGRKACVLF
jgi:hypothetical protein